MLLLLSYRQERNTEHQQRFPQSQLSIHIDLITHSLLLLSLQTIKSLLQLLIEATGEEEDEENSHILGTEDPTNAPQRKGILSDAQIISHCIVFLLAGYETTANTLAFTSYLLAMNPGIQEKLHSEIEKYFRTKPVSYMYCNDSEFFFVYNCHLIIRNGIFSARIE